MSTFYGWAGLIGLVGALVLALTWSAKRRGHLQAETDAHEDIAEAVMDKKARDDRLRRDPGLVERVRRWSRG